MNQFDREEQQLERDYMSGLMTHSEYNKTMRDLQREYRALAQESAEAAYRNELDRW